MEPARFRELETYSAKDIAHKLGLETSEISSAIGRLLDSGILQRRDPSSRDDESELVSRSASSDELYQFRFVGIALLGRLPIVCYPKYILSNEDPKDEMRQALAVIRRLGREGRLLDGGPQGGSDDHLAVVLRLIELYDEYGLYENFEETRVLNGAGTIDWQRTIDTMHPLISKGHPVYVDYWTRKTRRDDSDFVTRLHRSVLAECMSFLRDTGLAILFGLTVAGLSDESPFDLGSPDALVWRLERERAGQFVTWKQEVIDLLRRYIEEEPFSGKPGTVTRFGTTSYYHAWEVACKVAFGDLLDVRLRDLGIELRGSWCEKADETLQQIIPRPLWERPVRAGGFESLGDVDTLIPDTVTIQQDSDGHRTFAIYDAKYYVPSIGKSISNQPGIDSVDKQFLYQSAYRDFVVDNEFDRVENAFLVPSEKDKANLLARVSFPKVMDSLTNEVPQFTDHVDMWALPAAKVFNCYLNSSLFHKE